MENVRRVLEKYHIYPIDIEKITENVYKIKGNKQTYALKRSHLQEERLPFWLDIYRTAQTYNLQSILPVYLTHSGNLYVRDNNEIYYLTPWIESTIRTHSIEKVYQHIGYIHAKTRKNETVTNERRVSSKENFLVYKNKLTENRKKLHRYVEDFESEHFMSPVELLVCTQYRDLMKVFFILENRLNQYLNSIENISEIKVSLCHGKLKDSHVIHGNQYYFINWEHATYQHPIMDLAQLLKNKTLYFDSDNRLLLDKWKIYMDENKLENHELTLLTIYLLDPSNYIQAITDYTNRKSDNSNIDFVIRLQRLHRQLLFGVSFSEFIEEEYEMVPLDESGSES